MRAAGRRRNGFAAAAAVLLAVLAGATSSAAADSGPAGSAIYGIHEPNSWYSGPNVVTSDQVAAEISKLRAESHRFPVSWQEVERLPPLLGQHVYNFARYDLMYQADVSRGIRPLIYVWSAPTWAWPAGVANSGQGWGMPPGEAHLADWAAFCAAVARRYPLAAGIEIWNEPNYPIFWGHGSPQIPPDPAYYARVAAVASQAIRSVNPGMPVIGGSLAPFAQAVDGKIPARQFARGMLAAGAAAALDGISLHLYRTRPGPLDHRLFAPPLDDLREVELESGARLPIWITEIGITTTGPDRVTPDQQASVLADSFRWLQRQPDVRAFYIHTLSEPTQDDNDPEKGYALASGTFYPFTPKPAYYALQAAAGAGGAGKAGLGLRLQGRRSQRALRRGKVRIAAACRSWCALLGRGRLLIRAPGARRVARRLSPDRAESSEGHPSRLALAVPGAAGRLAKRALRHGGTVTARVSVVARNTLRDRARRGSVVRVAG